MKPSSQSQKRKVWRRPKSKSTFKTKESSTGIHGFKKYFSPEPHPSSPMELNTTSVLMLSLPSPQNTRPKTSSSASIRFGKTPQDARQRGGPSSKLWSRCTSKNGFCCFWRSFWWLAFGLWFLLWLPKTFNTYLMTGTTFRRELFCSAWHFWWCSFTRYFLPKTTMLFSIIDEAHISPLAMH